MPISFRNTVRLVAALLLAAAVTQSVYTALYASGAEVPRQLLWGIEGVIFTLMAAFAGAAMLEAKQHFLAWSAIGFAAVLNVVQVGVGLTLFGPFFEVAREVEAFAPAAAAIVAYSFMVYNAAKLLLALALIVFALARLGGGSRLLGWFGLVVGCVAAIANALSMALGRDFAGELPIAGGSGVLATMLLAICLFSLPREEA
ncbi:thiamine biosynthesis protein ThiC [Erythrobacter aurantius]|uniref:thiamine biosynthesis protein ThiC n=1 Tax=Erythrobacter aurantius TaxID=2909249 RepID=UPI002079C71B|nr:thiamine biosynthesis protein ThiC [Erythrobacter aurantius]